MPFEYEDPILHEVRRGDSASPFKDIEETLIIDKSGNVFLTEYPNKFRKVAVFDDKGNRMYEISSGIPNENAYLVNYSSKKVTFNKVHIGKQFLFKYVGQGNSFIPINAIYTQRDGLKVTETLDKFYDRADNKIKETEETRQQVIKTTNEKMEEVEQTRLHLIDEVNQQIDKSEQTRLNLIDEAEQTKQEVIKKTNEKIEETEQARQRAHRAADFTNEKTLKFEEVVNSSKKIYKPMVETYEDLLATYPNPEIGWTATVKDTKIVYRWDGVDWVDIGVTDRFDGYNVVVSDLPPINLDCVWLHAPVTSSYGAKIKPSETEPEKNQIWWVID